MLDYWRFSNMNLNFVFVTDETIAVLTLLKLLLTLEQC